MIEFLGVAVGHSWISCLRWEYWRICLTKVSDDRNLSSLLTIRAGASATPTTYCHVHLQNVSDGTRQGKFPLPWQHST